MCFVTELHSAQQFAKPRQLLLKRRLRTSGAGQNLLAVKKGRQQIDVRGFRQYLAAVDDPAQLAEAHLVLILPPLDSHPVGRIPLLTIQHLDTLALREPSENSARQIRL